MARTKNPITVDETGNEIAPEVAESLLRQQNEASERLALVVAQYGDGLPFDPHRYEYIIRDHLARSAEAMLAAGRALIVAREHLAHGDFLPFVARIGIEERVARRMMQAAVKFSDDKTAKIVDAAGNKTKLFELLVLDDEQIDDLAGGGTVAGLTLDDVEKMAASQLRAALREAREEDKAKDKLLADKNSKIDTLQAELEKTRRRIAQATPDEQAQQAATDVAAVSLGLISDITTPLRESIDRLLSLHPDSVAAVAGHITQVRQTLDSLCAEFSIGTIELGPPAWAQED